MRHLGTVFAVRTEAFKGARVSTSTNAIVLRRFSSHFKQCMSLHFTYCWQFLGWHAWLNLRGEIEPQARRVMFGIEAHLPIRVPMHVQRSATGLLMLISMKTVQNLISKSSQVCIAYILTLVRSVPWLIQCSGAGFGGFELISYQLYGDPTPGIYGQEVVDWGQYGFGSAAWKNMIGVFASAAAENGLNMDFALGPNQGAGVPVQDQTAPGLSTGLEYGYFNISGGQQYSGPLPDPDLSYSGRSPSYWVFPDTSASPATLVAAVAGHITRYSNNEIFLNQSTMIDLTAMVKDGNVNFTVPGVFYDQWTLFSFWQRRTGQYESRQGLTNSYPLTSNGSFIVDHFSAAGAQLSAQFMDQNAITAGDFETASMYAWEDSAELVAPLLWTDNFTQSFLSRRGYSPTTALPLFFTSYPARTFYYDQPDQGQKYVNDYYQTLTECYLEYLQTFKLWAHSRGFQYSNQPYGFPIDFVAASSIADAPECESLEFNDNVDAYRQFAGGVNMAQARIMSSETGAHYGQSYSLTWPTLLLDVRSNHAGGVSLSEVVEYRLIRTY